MPTSKIKKDAREGKGSVPSLEKKWDKAKDAAGSKGGKQNWPLTMHIYENETKGSAMPQLNAATRLAASTKVTAAPSFPHIIGLFKAHDENVGGKGSKRSDAEYKKDLDSFVSRHGDANAQKLENFLRGEVKRFADLSDVSLGETPRGGDVPADIMDLLHNLFVDEE